MTPTRIFLDVETIPSQAPNALAKAAANIKVPKNYSKPDTIEKYIRENTEVAWRNTALDGSHGELLVIGFAFGADGPVESLFRTHGEPERLLLERFWGRLSEVALAPVWIGHNVLFDLKFLYHRSVVLGIPVPDQLPIAPSPWHPRVFDTSYYWTWERNRYISLEELADVLNVEVNAPDDITGATVWDAVKAGRLDDLVKYNKSDVETVRSIYNIIDQTVFAHRTVSWDG